MRFIENDATHHRAQHSGTNDSQTDPSSVFFVILNIYKSTIKITIFNLKVKKVWGAEGNRYDDKKNLSLLKKYILILSISIKVLKEE